MKLTLSFFFMIFSLNLFASDLSQVEDEAFAIKEELNFQQYLLKLDAEKALISLEQKTESSADLLFKKTNLHRSIRPIGILNECADWVYLGPGSREDAVRACRGVRSMECVEWVYLGPGSRQDAARACSGVVLKECVEWVYLGPGSRIDAAKACMGVRDMECVEELYRGSSSKQEAAEACGYNRRPPSC